MITDEPAEQVEEARVPPELEGARLDAAAAKLFSRYSRARLQTWIDGGALQRNGLPALKTRERVAAGDLLSLEVPDADPEGPVEPQPIPLEVLHADAAFAVIEKPVGLVVHPGAGVRDGTLQNALLHRFPQTAALPRAGIVHRLDKDTSGLLVVALSLPAHKALVEALAARRIRREYEAIANGAIVTGGTVEAPIGRDPRNRLRMAVTPGGRSAVTHYRLLRRFAHHTHLRVRLETGRTHQIRVHLAHLRHPLVGDALYGGKAQRGTGLSAQARAALLDFPRQALHACELVLRHPLEAEREMTFTSKLPEDFRGLLEMLEPG